MKQPCHVSSLRFPLAFKLKQAKTLTIHVVPFQPDEMGAMMAVFGLALNAGVLVGGSGLSAVYEASVGVAPGIVFLVSAAMALVALLAVLWVHAHRQRATERRLGEATEIEDDLEPLMDDDIV